MTPDPIPRPDLIGIASPADKGDLALSLYLCAVRENGDARRNEMQLQGGVMRYPPLSLDLHYLLTAHSTADLQTRALDEHRLLGRAAQVLYDHAIVRSPYLEGTLAEMGEELRITSVGLDPDQIARYWSFGDLPYKLSLVYRVGPVLLESNRVKAAPRVVERRIKLEEKEGG